MSIGQQALCDSPSESARLQALCDAQQRRRALARLSLADQALARARRAYQRAILASDQAATQQEWEAARDKERTAAEHYRWCDRLVRQYREEI